MSALLPATSSSAAVGADQVELGVIGYGRSSCLPCTPGTYNNDTALVGDGCTACPQGKLSEGLRETECSACPVGGFCGAEAAFSLRQTFEPCPAGFYNPTTGAYSNASCIPCPVGTANPIPGSSNANVCVNCLPGSFAATTGRSVCELSAHASPNDK